LNSTDWPIPLLILYSAIGRFPYTLLLYTGLEEERAKDGSGHDEEDTGTEP
jgi:hypothetical protein